MITKLLPLTVLLLLCSLSGCAKYEFDIVSMEPMKEGLAPSSSHIARKQNTTVSREPLLYKMTSYQNRLVIQVQNGSQTPILLVGQKSATVDHQGQSRPIKTVNIQPGSVAKLILPPIRPQVRSRGGSGVGVGYGSGIGFGSGFRREYGYTSIEDDVGVYDDGGVVYWEWPSETTVQLNLVYNDGTSEFTEKFAFRKVKVK